MEALGYLCSWYDSMRFLQIKTHYSSSSIEVPKRISPKRTPRGKLSLRLAVALTFEMQSS